MVEDALEEASAGDCTVGIQGSINQENSPNSQNSAFCSSEWLVLTPFQYIVGCYPRTCFNMNMNGK